MVVRQRALLDRQQAGRRLPGGEPAIEPVQRLRRGAALAFGLALVAGCGGGDPDRPAAPAADDPGQIFALGRRPQRPLDVEAAWAAPFAQADRRLDGFSVSIAATFPTRRSAETTGRRLARVLTASAAWLAHRASAAERSAPTAKERVPPLPPVEKAWLRAHGVHRRAGGIGWAGPGHATAPPVQVLGSTVIVTDLKYVAAYDKRAPYGNPLVTALRSAGAKVLVEGDTDGEGAIVADVSCEGRPAAAATVGADVADYVALPAGYLARPPWYPGGITPAERRARRTYRGVSEEYGRRLQTLIGDPRVTQLALEMARSSPEKGRKTFARLQKLLLEQTLAAAPDLEDKRLDPVVVSWWVADQARAARVNERAARDPSILLKTSKREERARAERELRRGVHVGQLRHARATSGRPFPARGETDAQLYYANVGWSGRQLDIGFASGARIAVLFPSLVRYVHRGGCRRISYALVDYDEVRGD